VRPTATLVCAALLAVLAPAHAMTNDEYQTTMRELESALAAWKQLRDQDVQRLKRQDEKIALLLEKNDSDKLFNEAQEKLNKATLKVAKDIPKAMRPMRDGKLVKLGKEILDNGVVILSAHSEMLKAMEAGGPEFGAKLAAMEKFRKGLESGIELSEAGMKQQTEAMEKLRAARPESEFSAAIKKMVADAIVAGQRLKARKEREEQHRKNEARERRNELGHERRPGPVMGSNPADFRSGVGGGVGGKTDPASQGENSGAKPAPTPVPTPPKPTPITPVPVNPNNGDGPVVIRPS
jgi:hypothetical protein